ncbi:MAG: 50S ribosomal protein L6 [Candidatus Marsarchaeota archaeon]|nr:50S ribosomal protein L6 [Candidatus Marsarchaeota archaeon]
MDYIEIEIPDGVKVEVKGGAIDISFNNLSKNIKFNEKIAVVSSEEGKVKLKLKEKERRKSVAILYSVKAHILKAFKGFKTPFVKNLEVVYAHFPVSIEVKKDEVLIKNFLGERIPRIARVMPGVEVKVEGQKITVKGFDKDGVGQTASNIVRSVKIKNKDIRVFQDGVYYVQTS